MKNKTKGLARLKVKEHRKTGGGEADNSLGEFTPTKERILNLIGGWDVITGENVREFGPKSRKKLPFVSAPSNEEGTEEDVDGDVLPLNELIQEEEKEEENNVILILFSFFC